MAPWQDRCRLYAIRNEEDMWPKLMKNCSDKPFRV
jgi:hypothetical protein